MSRFIPVQEAIRLPLLGERDYLQRSKGRYLTWAKWVWQDMELSSVKIARRQFFNINKRTRTVDLPCDFLQLCSVNVIDHCGVFLPVYLNDRLHDDMTDVAAAKDCACEYKCGYKLCNTIKGYEAIQTVKSDYLPNGDPIEFNCVDRKAVDANGFLYTETQSPLRIYESGIWTDTILHTEQTKLCEVTVDKNGCCCDTEENINNVCNSCGITDCDYQPPLGGTANVSPEPQDNTWIYYCNTKMDWFGVQCGNYPHGYNRNCNNIYNISELGNRLIFPHNFGYDRVMIRYYADVNLNDLQIPVIAVDTFIMGLKWFDNKYSNNPAQLALADKFGRQYALMKFGLLRELNKYRIAELAKIFTPPKYIPSYTLGRYDQYVVWYGNGYDNNAQNYIP